MLTEIETHSRDLLRTLLHYTAWTNRCCTKTSHVNHIKHTTHANKRYGWVTHTNKRYGWVKSFSQLFVHILTPHHCFALSNQIKHKPYYSSHVYTPVTWCTLLHQLGIVAPSLAISSEQLTCANYYYAVEPTPVPIMNCCTQSSHINQSSWLMYQLLLTKQLAHGRHYHIIQFLMQSFYIDLSQSLHHTTTPHHIVAHCI